MAIYCYTVNTDIFIWCGVAYTWAPAEIFVEGGGASLKRPLIRTKGEQKGPTWLKKSQ